MKTNAFFFVLGAAIFSGSAVAAPLPAGGVVAMATCATIGQDVTINTSANVIGAFSCNEAGNAAALGTCHTSGSRKTTIYTCTSLDAGVDGISGNADDEWNVSPCPAGNVAGQVGKVQIAADYTGFVVSTTGGGVAGTPLKGVCDTTASNIDKLLPF
ncbi:hypothetical protein D3C85_1327710 [compost metagenome]